MSLHKLSWILWIPGTVVIMLSWFNLVPARIGWIGFWVALAGTLLSFVPSRSRACPTASRGPASAALDDLAKLADLRERGAISEQEFWEKKKALMDRMGP